MVYLCRAICLCCVLWSKVAIATAQSDPQNAQCSELVNTMATHLGVDPSTWGWTPGAQTSKCDKGDSQHCTAAGPETCDYFKSVEVKLFLGNGIMGFDGAGTFDDIMIEFKNSHQTLLKHPSRGDETKQPIDLVQAFGSNKVSLDDVKAFQIYSVQDERTNPDYWEIGGISITATCAESSRTVVMNKYDNMYEWFNRFGDIRGDLPARFKGSIAAGDWKWEHEDAETKTIAVMPPGQGNACTKFKSIKAHLELGSGISALTAGTNDDLVLDFTDEMFPAPEHIIPFASSPSHGQVIDEPIDLKTIFGESVVPTQDVRHVRLYSTEGTSHRADPWQVATFELRAECEGSSRKAVVTKWRNLYKWFDRFEGPSTLSGDLTLQDWRWE